MKKAAQSSPIRDLATSRLAPFEHLTWLCAFALGLTVAHLVSFSSAIPMYIMIAVWLGAISLRIAAEARS